MSPAELTRDQVLDELVDLAGVNHALIVEYLTLHCALGHDLGADEGGPQTDGARAVAQQAFTASLSAMFRLKGLNIALGVAGRPPVMDRATSVIDVAGAAISLEPPDPAALARFPDRERVIADAVGARYARLVPAVTTHPVFEGKELDDIRPVITEDGPSVGLAVDNLRDAVGDQDPGGLLRVVRRTAADSFEQRLLDASDRGYELVLAALRQQFAAQDFFVAGAFRSLAERAMMGGLDPVNRLLVQRGLLPPFTAP